MAKPPESNWRISHSEVEEAEDVAGPWAEPAYDMGDPAATRSRFPLLLVLIIVVLAGVGIWLAIS